MNPVERRATGVALTVLLAALGGCDSSPTEVEGDHTQAVVAFADLASTARPSTADEPFVLPCPAGGRIVIEGTTQYETLSGTLTLTWDRSMRYEDCTMNRNGTEMTAAGQFRTAGEARFGQPVNHLAPLLYQLSIQTGTMTTIVNGTSRTCAYEMRNEFDPAENTFRITGTACGRAIDLTVPVPAPPEH